MREVKHPEITVQLTGQNGNAFMIMGLVAQAMRRAKVPKDEIDQYMNESTSGDYNNVLVTAMRWVNVE